MLAGNQAAVKQHGEQKQQRENTSVTTNPVWKHVGQHGGHRKAEQGSEYCHEQGDRIRPHDLISQPQEEFICLQAEFSREEGIALQEDALLAAEGND